MTAPPELLEKRRLLESMMAGRPEVPGVSGRPVHIGGVPVLVQTPLLPRARLLYFHGGGYRLGSPAAIAPFTAALAAALEVEIFSVDYRLAPEHPFPAGIEDGMAVARTLADGPLLIGGDSAGGGVAACLLTAGPEQELPVFAGGLLLCPWVDLRVGAPSFLDCADTDRMFSLAMATEAADMYLAGHDPANARVSPVLADWTGCPPLAVQNSTTEVLRDDARALVATARACGVDVRHDEYPDQPHVFHYAHPDTAASVAAVAALRAFVDGVLPG
ncbi:alpha/beta hydrolase [Nakamurella alba]|nr:alpha/beta hydrolase [Nakamurella alba]